MSNLATIVNNILADSGIDDINVVVTTGSYTNPSWIVSLPWTKITGKPTTIAGYGITDAYTKTEVDTLLSGKQNTLTLTTTGTSGAATLVGATLNIPQYQSVLTNPVTGTGVAGQVAYWSSTSAITGESNLFWDATNNRLGINTANPSVSLDVVGGYISSGTAASPSGSKILWGNYSNGALTTFGSSFSSGGPVIGYGVSPSTSAELAFVSSTGITLSRGAYYIGGGNHYWYAGSSQTVAIDSAVTMVNTMSLNASGVLTVGADLILSAANPFVFGGTAVGSVGLSNIGGQTYVRVFGASHATLANATQFVNSGSTSLLITSLGAATFSSLAGSGTRMVIADANGLLSTQAITVGTVTGTGVAGQVAFWSDTSVITGDAGFTWDSTNDILKVTGSIFPTTDNTGVIGNASFTWSNGQFTNLTIDSTLNVRAAIDLADNDILRFGSSDDWEFFHDGTNNLMDLNVGDFIIRDNVTTKITIQRTTGNIISLGGASFTGTLSATKGDFGTTFTTTNILQAFAASATDASLFQVGMVGVTNGFTIDRVASNIRYTFLDGDVGIGATPTNGARLQVSGVGTFLGRLDVTGTTNYSALRTTNTSGNIYWGVDNSTGSDFTGVAYARFIYSEGAYPLITYVNGSERMRITSAGNVGIGASPSTRLTVSGGYSNFTDGTVNIYLGSDGTGGLLGTITNHYFRFITNDIERMRIFAGGNTHIGPTPSFDNGAQLQVSGSVSVGAAGQITLTSGDLRYSSNAGFGIVSADGNRLVSIQNGAFGVTGAVTITADAGNEQLTIRRASNTNEQLIFGFHSSDYAQIQAVEQGVAYRPLALQPNGGNVGIGIFIASELLDIRGVNRDETSGQFNQVIYSTSSQDAGRGGSIGFGGFSTGTSISTTFGAIKGFKENGFGDNTAGVLGFYTRPNGGAMTERVRITSGGNTELYGNLALRASATGSTATHVPVFTADPAATTRSLLTRTLQDFKFDVGSFIAKGVRSQTGDYTRTLDSVNDYGLWQDNFSWLSSYYATKIIIEAQTTGNITSTNTADKQLTIGWGISSDAIDFNGDDYCTVNVPLGTGTVDYNVIINGTITITSTSELKMFIQVQIASGNVIQQNVMRMANITAAGAMLNTAKFITFTGKMNVTGTHTWSQRQTYLRLN